jgi:hypothetical protein
MKVTLRPITEIKPYERNPRLNDDAIDAVAASIREFGFRQPIVVDGDDVIICGHTRFKAATKLGLEKVPVHVAKDLTPDQIKAYRIADNKTAELAEWNFELLPIEIGELQSCNYDLGLLGFDSEELAKLLDPGIEEGLHATIHFDNTSETKMQLPSSMTLMSAARADWLAWASSAPGCIQMFLMPAAIASATIWRVIAGGVMMERASGTRGSSVIVG